MSRGLKAKSYSRIPDVYNLPTLIEVQLDSFKWFISDGAARPVRRGDAD